MGSRSRSRVTDVVRSMPGPKPGRSGDPGLFGPGSIAWRIGGARPVTILGGGRALLMQIAHPLVAAGVADHSDVDEDPFGRLWGTLDVVLDVLFGDRGQAVAAAERVNRIHAGVVGRRGDRDYRAMDPELLLWVHATLVDTTLVTFTRFVRPLSARERERYYQEMRSFAGLFRVPEEALPVDLPAFERYVRSTVAELVVSREARRLAGTILEPPVPPVLAPVARMLRQVTVGLLPPELRAGFGLPWGPNRERGLRAAAWGIRRTLPLLPANITRWPHEAIARGRCVSDGEGIAGTSTMSQ